MRSAPERSPALIRTALGKAAAAAGVAPSQARLVLAVDQMEELFTTQAEPASREALVRLLAAFAGSGLVWVIATIRADFFHRLREIPGFSALKDGLASYELLPPTGPEIAQIIREPARAAGLRFEETADQGRLEDVLQEAAVADPGSLPLLEFVLDALYEAGRERRLLTFAAYRALGGLEGAIARRADEVVDALPPEIQDALPAVLRALTTVRLGDETITARPAPFCRARRKPAQAALVDALIAARLLVGDEDAEGHAVVRVAHEALLNRWPRARDIVNADRQFLETRARVQADARRWLSDRQEPGASAAGRQAAGRSRGAAPVAPHEIDAARSNTSRRRPRRRRRRRRTSGRRSARASRRRRRPGASAWSARRSGGGGRRSGGGTRPRPLQRRRGSRGAPGSQRPSHSSWRSAPRQARSSASGASRRRSGKPSARRKTPARRAPRRRGAEPPRRSTRSEERGSAQSIPLASVPLATGCRHRRDRGRNPIGPGSVADSISAPDRPFLPEAEAALYKALFEHRQTMVFRHDGGVTHAAFSPTGTV